MIRIALSRWFAAAPVRASAAWFAFFCAYLACAAPPAPVAERSAVGCGPCEARADGREQVRVVAVLRDAAGQPVRGARVLFESDGAITGEDGAAFLALASSTAETRRIEVRLADGTPLGPVAVRFYAGSLPRVDLRPR
jgi:hypothetical protein